MKKRLRKKLGKWNAKEWRARGFVPVESYRDTPLPSEEFDAAVAVLKANEVPMGSIGQMRCYFFKGPIKGGGSRKALREHFNAGTTPGGNAVQNDAP